MNRTMVEADSLAFKACFISYKRSNRARKLIGHPTGNGCRGDSSGLGNADLAVRTASGFEHMSGSWVVLPLPVVPKR